MSPRVYLLLLPTRQDLIQGQWPQGRLKVGIRGRGAGTSRGSSPALLCWSSTHLVQCEPNWTWTQILVDTHPTRMPDCPTKARQVLSLRGSSTVLNCFYFFFLSFIRTASKLWYKKWLHLPKQTLFFSKVYEWLSRLCLLRWGRWKLEFYKNMGQMSRHIWNTRLKMIMFRIKILKLVHIDTSWWIKFLQKK